MTIPFSEWDRHERKFLLFEHFVGALEPVFLSAILIQSKESSTSCIKVFPNTFPNVVRYHHPAPTRQAMFCLLLRFLISSSRLIFAVPQMWPQVYEDIRGPRLEIGIILSWIKLIQGSSALMAPEYIVPTRSLGTIYWVSQYVTRNCNIRRRSLCINTSLGQWAVVRLFD